jgi:hypothetical protein
MWDLYGVECAKDAAVDGELLGGGDGIVVSDVVMCFGVVAGCRLGD